MSEKPQYMFSVFAGVASIKNPLITINVPFGRLLDDIVVPYESNRSLIIDGATIKRGEVERFKILLQGPSFAAKFRQIHHELQHSSNVQVRRTIGDQYYVRMDALLRECCDDVTSQVVSACEKTFGAKLKDYLPKRDELIPVALRVFADALKSLGSSAG